MGMRATELRKGMVLQEGQNLLLITEYSHHTPGNLRAIIHIKTRNLANGSTGQRRLGSSDVLDVAYLDKKKCEYLYREANGDFVFMDQQSFDQFHVSGDLIGERMAYVKENSICEITFHGTQPIGVELPSSVVLSVAETENAVRGNTATNVKKEAKLETGLVIKVPIHISVGDVVKVRTEDGEFIGRVND